MPGETLPSLLPGGLVHPVTDGVDHSRIWVRGTVTTLASHSVTYLPIHDPDTPSRVLGEPVGDGQMRLSFDYMIYCLGARLPRPVDVSGDVPSMQGLVVGGKKYGVGFMRQQCKAITSKQRIVVVGGGALGIREHLSLEGCLARIDSRSEMASDIKAVHPSKQVTLVHSRDQLMPIYPKEFHDACA